MANWKEPLLGYVLVGITVIALAMGIGLFLYFIWAISNR